MYLLFLCKLLLNKEALSVLTQAILLFLYNVTCTKFKIIPFKFFEIVTHFNKTIF